jgi:hypothetical protein
LRALFPTATGDVLISVGSVTHDWNRKVNLKGKPVGAFNTSISLASQFNLHQSKGFRFVGNSSSKCEGITYYTACMTNEPLE